MLVAYILPKYSLGSTSATCLLLLTRTPTRFVRGEELLVFSPVDREGLPFGEFDLE